MAKYENEFKNIVLQSYHYRTQRGAGSMGIADVIAVQMGTSKAFLVECKSVNIQASKGAVQYISDSLRLKAQFVSMMGMQLSGIAACYAVRWKNDYSLRGTDDVKKWDIFPLTRYMEKAPWPNPDLLPDSYKDWPEEVNGWKNFPWPIMRQDEGLELPKYIEYFEEGEYNV